ncbi:MAG: IBR domain-containing protein [Ruminococcus sp.]|nr:IBR domain-containing protein [Ruminococcus sp.]
MPEVIKYPNCDAPIHITENKNTAKCEYCDTEIILNEYPENTITPDETDYTQLKQKWNSSIIITDIIQIAIAFIFTVLMNSNDDIIEGIGILVLFVSAVYSVAMPVHLAHQRPVIPNIKNPSKFSTGLMLYGLFLLSFFFTVFITVTA